MSLLSLALALGLMLLASHTAEARPYRGRVNWVVLLCKFRQEANMIAPYTPDKSVAFFQNMLVNAGTGGLEDYWNQVSYGSVSMAGTPVKGWYTMGVRHSDSGARTRDQRFQDCVDAAKSGGYTVPAGALTMVVTFPGLDLFGSPGKGAYMDSANAVGYYAHETGHGLGYEHSFSDNPTYKNAVWSMIGEYDDRWDTMSFGHVYSTIAKNASFGTTGPSLNVYNMDRMGWLPRSKIYSFGAGGEIDATVILQAHNTYNYNPNPAFSTTQVCAILRNCPTTYLMARIPFDFNDPFHYYTVSYRMKQGLDINIPLDRQILIHEVKKFSTTGAGARTWYSPVLLQDYSVAKSNSDLYPARTALNDANSGVRIDVVSLAQGSATIRIRSAFAKRCQQGYVWREACANDFVCVTPSDRTITRAENRAAANTVLPGSIYCKNGFVWREGCSNDLVCVTPDRRSANRVYNQLAASRAINKAASTYGPNTCKPGYVWREADDRDWVCVSGATRDQVKADNAAKFGRWNPSGAYGKYTCINGYVWREAFPGDVTCVSVAQRSQAAADNAAAQGRLQLVIA